jgi:hypothetical protein
MGKAGDGDPLAETSQPHGNQSEVDGLQNTAHESVDK